MKKFLLYILMPFLIILPVFYVWFKTPLPEQLSQYDPFKVCEVPLKLSSTDNNHNLVPDALDVVAEARKEVERKTIYDASYVAGGYPEEGRGACTDVIWRALKPVKINLKQLVDDDIRSHPERYGTTGEHPDPNIDFRRARNLAVYFSSHGKVMTTDVKPGNVSNLVNWQPGDIVIFGAPKEHIAVISDKRRRDGVPLIIHNSGPWAHENDRLLSWPTPITHHFRMIN